MIFSKTSEVSLGVLLFSAIFFAGNCAVAQSDVPLPTLVKTEYGDAVNHDDSQNMYFKWDDSSGSLKLVAGTSDDKDLTYFVNNTRENATERIIEDISGADIEKNFIGLNVSTSDYADGGAIYNGDNAAIGNIKGDFIGNYASSYVAQGGAIYNGYNAAIGNIKRRLYW